MLIRRLGECLCGAPMQRMNSKSSSSCRSPTMTTMTHQHFIEGRRSVLMKGAFILSLRSLSFAIKLPCSFSLQSQIVHAQRTFKSFLLTRSTRVNLQRRYHPRTSQHSPRRSPRVNLQPQTSQQSLRRNPRVNLQRYHLLTFQRSLRRSPQASLRRNHPQTPQLRLRRSPQVNLQRSLRANLQLNHLLTCQHSLRRNHPLTCQHSPPAKLQRSHPLRHQ
jgi:hypothetical protein